MYAMYKLHLCKEYEKVKIAQWNYIVFANDQNFHWKTNLILFVPEHRICKYIVKKALSYIIEKNMWK